MEKPRASPGSGSAHHSEKPTARTSDDPSLPKNGREKVAGLLADLLGFPAADRQPEAKTHKPNLYESMSRRFGNELKSAPTGTCAPSQDSQQDTRSVIYENCFKCQGARCHPPPRVAPAETHRNRNILTAPTFPSGPGLRKSQEHEVAATETPSDGSRSVDGQCQYEGAIGRTGEGKRPLQSFCDSFGFLFHHQCFKADLLFCFCSVLLINTVQMHTHTHTLSSWPLLFTPLFVFSLHSVMFPFVVLLLQLELFEGLKRKGFI